MDSIEGLHREESGQVTFLFVFASVALVVVLAFIINTARQTSRKIEMQGAADAAAVAGATVMARGMNLMVFNNKGMADILAVMIDIRSAYQAAFGTAIICDGLALIPPLTVEAGKEALYWHFVTNALLVIDTFLNDSEKGVGWPIMKGLDYFNQGVRALIPPVAVITANDFAQKNRADLGGIVSVKSLVPSVLPVFPMARGGKELLVHQAQICCLALLEGPTMLALDGFCEVVAFPCLSFPIAPLIFYTVAVPSNITSLQDGQASTRGSVGGGFLKDLFGGFIGKSLTIISDLFSDIGFTVPIPLAWPDAPPYPMILTDNPPIYWRDFSFGNPEPEVDYTADVDHKVVQQYLQYMSMTKASMQDSPIAPTRFQNPSWFGWVTYAQADAYNPILWGFEWGPFTQAWRAKLSRAGSLDKLMGSLARVIGIDDPGLGSNELGYFNTH
jgi:hypothetical protein